MTCGILCNLARTLLKRWQTFARRLQRDDSDVSGPVGAGFGFSWIYQPRFSGTTAGTRPIALRKGLRKWLYDAGWRWVWLLTWLVALTAESLAKIVTSLTPIDFAGVDLVFELGQRFGDSFFV